MERLVWAKGIIRHGGDATIKRTADRTDRKWKLIWEWMRSFPDSRQDEGYLVTERMYSVTKHVIRSRDLCNQGMSNNRIRQCQTVEGIREDLLRSLRLKEAAKPSWGCSCDCEMVWWRHICLAFGKNRSALHCKALNFSFIFKLQSGQSYCLGEDIRMESSKSTSARLVNLSPPRFARRAEIIRHG